MRLLLTTVLAALALGLSSPAFVQAGSTGPLAVQGWVTKHDLAAQATTNDPYFPDQWYLQSLKIANAWDHTTGSTTIIAIIDTGIQSSHPDLAGRLWINTREIAGNGIDDDRNGYIDDYNGYSFIDRNADILDRHGHGTGIASVIAASTNNNQGIAGVNRQARLMILKSLDQAGGGAYGDVAQALRYAADNGAKLVNMSFGAYASDDALESAIRYAITKGVIIVAAAGNAGSGTVFYPAASPDVISVGSVGRNNQRSYFSNYGTGLDVVAPGEDIALADSNGSYVRGAGTSFAAALVTGIVSLAVANNPSLTPVQAGELLRTSALKIGSTAPNAEYGYGIPDANAMVATPAKQLTAKIVATKTTLNAGGADQSVVTITVTDAAGIPQPNIPLTLNLTGGGNIINGIAGSTLAAGTTDGSGRITANIAAVVAGDHTLTVQSGAASLGGSLNLVFKNSIAPKYSMKWIRQSPYLSVAPAGSANLWVEVQNTGNVAWTSPSKDEIGSMKLGTDRSQDRKSQFADSSWLAANRAALMTPSIVRPNETARFSFSIIAPSQAGTYKEYFRPVAEYVSWLNDLGIYWDIRVGNGFAITDPAGYSAQLTSQTGPTSMKAGSAGSLTVKLQNTGSTTWSPSAGIGQVRLGTSDPNDRSSSFYQLGWESANRPISTAFAVGAGSTLTINFPIRAPLATGRYTETFQLVSEFVAWFGPQVRWVIDVTN